MNKILIKSAILIDGTGKKSFTGDLLIQGNKIEQVQKKISAPGAEEIDGKGHILSPGFIDVHSHSDFTLLLHPYAEGKVFQGVTTEVIGNCGQSAFPLLGECKNHIQQSWKRFSLKLDWDDFLTYKKRIEENGIAVNIAPLIGQGNIRASVMGYKDSLPTENELQQMRQLARKAMQEGAFGMSTGLIYLPGTFSTRSEIIEVMKEVRKENGVYATHLRNEGDTLLEAVEEAIEISRQSGGAQIQLSHLKTWGPQNWHKCSAVLKRIAQAKEEGLSIHFDRYPYLAAYTDLDALLPSWAYEGGKEKEIDRLQERQTRLQMEKELEEKNRTQKDYWNTIYVSSVATKKNKPYEGKSLQQIADLLGQKPVPTLFQILIEEKLEVGAIFFAMCEKNLKSIYKHRNCMVGSDSCARPFKGALADGKFHPRTYGTFPRFLAHFAKNNLLTWEEAIYRCTGLAAEKFKIHKRGKLEPGYYADLVLFNPEKIKDTATFENPVQPPRGIAKVWVNGQLVANQGKHTHKLPGSFLLKGKE